MTDHDSTDTDRLIERAQRGDRSAVDALMTAHRAYLKRVVELRLDQELRSRVDPSDVVQETQANAAERLPQYLQQRPLPFRLWLRQNALERIIDLRRHHLDRQKRSVRRESPLSVDSSICLARNLLSGPSARLRRNELAEQVQQAIGEMRENDREMLLLRHVEELTNDEAAQLLGIAPAAAAKRYGRSLIRFRNQLNDLGISPED